MEHICMRVNQKIEILSKEKEDINGISFVVSKDKFDSQLRETIKERTDDWAFEVRGRVEAVSCLRAEEAVYHRKCYQLFHLGRKR